LFKAKEAFTIWKINTKELKMDLDDWQKEVLAVDGNLVLRSGRQVGKSTIISIKAALFALEHPDTLVLVVASVERQALLLFEKTLGYLLDHHKKEICTGTKRPTKHVINLKNHSRIIAAPCGLNGHGIRGYTADLVIFDEAAFIPELVFISIIPALMTRKTRIVLLSTPFGREGFFFNCFSDPTYTKFHISSLDCPRANKEFLEHQKATLSQAVWEQEYLGEFSERLRCFFSTELISSIALLKRLEPASMLNPVNVRPPGAGALEGKKYMGVDLARMGSDQSSFCSLRRTPPGKIEMFDLKVTEKTVLTDSIRLIKELENQYNYFKVAIDSAGLGAAVYDILNETEGIRRKLVPIDNSTRSLDREGKQHRRLLKEDLYANLLGLMQRQEILIFDDPELIMSLRSIQYEYTDKKDIKIWGAYDHITESLTRAAWLAAKDKGLNIWVDFK
jgi:hypothetical protein